MIFGLLIRLWEVIWFWPFDQIMGNDIVFDHLVRLWEVIWYLLIWSDFGKCYDTGHLIRLWEVIMIYSHFVRFWGVIWYLVRLWEVIWYLVISPDFGKWYHIDDFVRLCEVLLYWVFGQIMWSDMIFGHLVILLKVIWYLFIRSDFEKWYDIWLFGQFLGSLILFDQILGSDMNFGQLVKLWEVIRYLVRFWEVLRYWSFDHIIRSDNDISSFGQIWGNNMILGIWSDLGKGYDIGHFFRLCEWYDHLVRLWWVMCYLVRLLGVIWHLVICSDYEKWLGRRTFNLTFVYIFSDFKLSFQLSCFRYLSLSIYF